MSVFVERKWSTLGGKFFFFGPEIFPSLIIITKHKIRKKQTPSKTLTISNSTSNRID